MNQAQPAPATWYDRSARTRLEVAGPDRAKFLHNLTTNDVKRLARGAGHESFVTSPQGKTLAYVTCLATDDALLIRTDPGAVEALLPHLRKYGIFDDVAIADVSAETFEYHLVGPGADELVTHLGVDPATIRPLDHRAVDLVGESVRLVRENLLGEPGWTWIGPKGLASAIRLEYFGIRGGKAGDATEFEARRIAAGTPLSGPDVQAGNLPQEVGRDARAINFVKGCYLGQETVARLDALGHVNKILRGGHVEGTDAVPSPGTALVDGDGKVVGTITSAAFSAERGVPIFLGYVRVAQAGGGTRLAIPSLAGADGGPVTAVVAELPSA